MADPLIGWLEPFLVGGLEHVLYINTKNIWEPFHIWEFSVGTISYMGIFLPIDELIFFRVETTKQI
jgi:hypothetical protein